MGIRVGWRIFSVDGEPVGDDGKQVTRHVSHLACCTLRVARCMLRIARCNLHVAGDVSHVARERRHKWHVV